MTDGWPQELPKRGPRYGNFKPTPAEREKAKKKPSAQQRREGNSAKHLAAIRKCPCLACGRIGHNDPHHLRSGFARAERGIGMKCTDRWTIPVCRRHHEELEAAGARGELDLFKSWGYADLHTLCVALYDAPSDPAIMTRIILAHRSVPR